MDEGWMEIDCPICGIDYDVSLDSESCPGCDHKWSEQDVRDAHRYDGSGSFIKADA